MSAFETRFSVRWQCRSYSQPITAFSSRELAHPLDEIAFAIVIPIGHHGAVEAEQHAVDRKRRLELREDAVAHHLVIGLAASAGRLRPETGALDQGKAVGGGALAGDVKRRRRVLRRVRMLARRIGEGGFEIGVGGRDGREGVRLGSERGSEDAHEG